MILVSDRELAALNVSQPGLVVDCAFCANAIENKADRTTVDCTALNVQTNKNVHRICSAFVERK